MIQGSNLEVGDVELPVGRELLLRGRLEGEGKKKVKGHGFKGQLLTWFKRSQVCWQVLSPGAEMIQYSKTFMVAETARLPDGLESWIRSRWSGRGGCLLRQDVLLQCCSLVLFSAPFRLKCSC